MHNISNLFYFETTFYMFWMVFLSIIRSLRVHTASGICHTEIPKMGTVTSECIYVQW